MNAAIAAVQADDDASEAAANDALALKAPLADPDFTGVLKGHQRTAEFDSNLTKVHNVLRGTSIIIGNNITLNLRLLMAVSRVRSSTCGLLI